MREHHFTAFRSGLLTALGLLQACGGQAEHEAASAPASQLESAEPDDAPAVRAECISRYNDVRTAEEPMAAALAADACLSGGGSNCDEAFISEAAALCIVQTEELLTDGLLPWGVYLGYNAVQKRVTWAVSNTTFDENPGKFGGTQVDMDATTGVVLKVQEWSAIDGRPFVVNEVARTADAMQRTDYTVVTSVCLDGVSPEARAALAAEWTRVSLLEHASIAAFARFALQLLGLGAPPHLLQASQQAMQDELRHTQLAFGLASSYAGTPLGPGCLNLEHALDAPEGDLLAHVAMNTLVEGCIGETLAALAAREGASEATDPYVREVLTEIARDEERHAQLAWRFLDWALAERPSLAGLLDAARREWSPSRLAPPSAAPRETSTEIAASYETTLRQHGILPPAQRQELEAQAFEQVLAPCLLALLSKHARTASTGVHARRAHVSPAGAGSIAQE